MEESPLGADFLEVSAVLVDEKFNDEDNAPKPCQGLLLSSRKNYLRS